MPTINLVTELPGPNSKALVARREAATPRGAAKLTPVAIVKAEGAAVTDADGNTLLDFAGGIGVLAVGHCPPNVVEAIQKQTADLIHLCAIVGTYPSYVEVAELMNEVTPGDFPKKTVLLNSGAEGLETAVKIARASTGRPAIIVFEGAYHGRTNLTLAMTSKYGLFKKGFGPFAPEIYRLPFPNIYRRPVGMTEEQYIDDCIARLEYAFTSQVDPSAVAAVVIETVQGEGGFIATPPKFLGRIRDLCTQHGIVYVADEVQCGFGRTGKLFAVEHYNIAPDLIVTAKSLAAGMPLAAVTGKAEIMDGPHPGGLGGTYSGNPLACVAAVEAINMIRQPEFLERANQIGARIREHLLDLQAAIPLIGDVRGLGAMMLTELVKDRDLKTPASDETLQVTTECFKRGLIAIRAGLFSNCIRFLPPLNISDEQVDEGMGVIAEAIRVVESSRRAVAQ
ncbi:MAG: 4-aminobutyrate--2-oxoglutarate transaminase [Anaerolineae bacterium]|nr:4-aminobutyrate--2-oxoglutarate transaminase [Anaerolineae bacterium]